MTFSYKSRYDRLFQKVSHKGGESSMNYIKILQNSQALSVSVVNSYSEYQLMQILWVTFTELENILLEYLSTKYIKERGKLY